VRTLYFCTRLLFHSEPITYRDFVKSLDVACFPRLRDKRRKFDLYGIVADDHLNDPYITRLRLVKYEDWVDILQRIDDADNVRLFSCLI
jgi:hypothetical protein